MVRPSAHPSIQRWQSATLVASLLVLPGGADAQAGFALPREAEAPIRALLAAAPLPEGCRWSGAVLDRDRVRSRYRCEDRRIELVLVHQTAAIGGASRTAHFALLPNEHAPAELERAVLAAVREAERGDLWRYVGPPSVVRESAPPIRSGTWAALFLASLLIPLGAALAWRRRDPATVAKTDPPLWPLLGCLGVVWLGSGLVMLTTFRFVMDDFTYLNTAITEPWTFDPELRVIGVRLPFYLGTRAGGTAPFIALNLTAYAAVLTSSAALARRLGGHRHEAGLAALLVGLQPGFFELMRYASGFQQLLALALVLWSLLALDHGATRTDARGRLGFALLGLGLALAAVLTKYPTAAVIVLAAPLWTARAAPDWKAAAKRSLPVVGLGALMLAPLLNADIDLIGDRGGGHSLRSNAWRIGLGAGGLLLSCLAATTALLVLRKTTLGRGRARELVVEWLAECVTERAGFVTERAGRVTERAGRVTERAGLPIALLLLTTAILFALPFLLNEQYFKNYYVTFPTVWVAIWGARAVARAWPAKRSWLRWGIAAGLALLLVPTGAIRESLAPIPRNRIGEWLAEAEEALTDAPRARTIGLSVRCPAGADTEDSQRLLEQYHLLGEHGHGLRWIAGLDPGVEILLDEPAEVTLHYCESERPRLWLAD